MSLHLRYSPLRSERPSRRYARRTAPLFVTLLFAGLLAGSALFAWPMPVMAQSDNFMDSGQRLGQESSLAVALGDVDGDGDLDAFVGNDSGQPDQIWLNDGYGRFTDSQQALGRGSTRDVALADFNGDGALDAFVVNGDGQPDTVWINDGHGVFSDSGQLLGASSGVSVAIADFTSDGFLDAYVATAGTAGGQSGKYEPDELWTNDGTGHFSVQEFSAQAATGVAAGDLNHDGKPDLYVSNSTGNPPDQVWMGNGTGFTRSGANLGSRPGRAVALGDVNADGWLDAFLVRADIKGNFTNEVWLSTSSGTRSLVTILGLATAGKAIALGDIDGDGRLDAVTVSGTDKPDQLWLNRGEPNRPFSNVQPINEVGYSADVALGDLNGDGYLDAFIVNQANQPNTVLFNTGAGRFTNIGEQLATSDSRAATIADLNGDVRPDIVMVGEGDGASNVWFNQGGAQFRNDRPADLPSLPNGQAIATGDLDGNGTLDVYIAGLPGQGDQLWFNTDGSGQLAGGVGQSLATPNTQDVALADLDGDGDLDAFVVSGGGAPGNMVWRNDGQVPPANALAQVATDLITGTAGVTVALQAESAAGISGTTATTAGELLTATEVLTATVPLSDSAPVANGATTLPYDAWFTDTQQRLGTADSRAVALGDLDGDGDLDVVVANPLAPSDVYFNRGDGTFVASSQGLPVTNAQDVALGDIDGDGDLDAVFANGSFNQPNRIFFNDGTGHFVESQQTLDGLIDYGVTLADMDGDGDLDAVFGHSGGNTVGWNDGSGHFVTGKQTMAYLNADKPEGDIVVGDLDGDGSPDIFSFITDSNDRSSMASSIWSNRSALDRIAQLKLTAPTGLPSANPYAVSPILENRQIPISYTLSLPVASTLPRTLGSDGYKTDLYYSLNGGGQWYTTTLSSSSWTDSKSGATLQWDTQASDLFGQSDNVVLRLVTSFLPASALTQTHLYSETIAGPIQWPALAAVSTPFRVRGQQVRVMDDLGHAVEGAAVFRRPFGDSNPATLIVDDAGNPYLTNANGYLAGRGKLSSGDQLVALAPVGATDVYYMYYTSAEPTEAGLAFTNVSSRSVDSSGIQTLTVAPTNTLLLFDLDVSLEWDARNDQAFLTNLKSAIQSASEVLYDVTEGQVALGNVRIFQAKEYRGGANLVIYASNSIHPRASMGGSVAYPMSDISGTQVITDAYIPGQIRMGPNWDPFGQSQMELQQDWRRALAHELSHYLLFLPDNYLGVDNGILKLTDCKGSFMTDAYDETNYGEFLTRDQWTGDCLKTVAQRLLTGRADWDTIANFLPIIEPANREAVKHGPRSLPLAVTNVKVYSPLAELQDVSTPALPSANYMLRDESGSITVLRQATAYLYRMGATARSEDEKPVVDIIALGSTGNGSDRIMVRGTRPGDKVCLFDLQHDPQRVGCSTVTGRSPSIQLQTVPEWQPQITVSPVSSVTLVLTITQALSGGVLRAQALPAYGPPTGTILARIPAVTLQPANPDDQTQWTSTITLPYPTFEGTVHVWEAGIQYPHEALTEYFLSSGFGPNERGGVGPNERGGVGPNERGGVGPNERGGVGPNEHGGVGPNERGGVGPNERGGVGPNERGGVGPNERAWGANQRSMEAPVASGDGRVTVFSLENLIGSYGRISLQALDSLAGVPQWLTPVGRGYRFTSSAEYTRTIAFHYLQHDVPEGYEYGLSIYFLPIDSDVWQRLNTTVDEKENFAAAQMPEQSQGVYALMSTVALPALQPGWNYFAYTIPETRTVGSALASIDGGYTVLYQYDPTSTLPWRLFDAQIGRDAPEFAALVNNLNELDYGRSYLIFASQTITPYLAVPGPHLDETKPPERVAFPNQAEVASVTESGLPLTPTSPTAKPAFSLDIVPATYYGFITGTNPISPTSDITLTARVGELECGTGQVIRTADRVLYTIRVAADAEIDGCGRPGAKVSFILGDQVVATTEWSNMRAMSLNVEFR